MDRAARIREYLNAGKQPTPEDQRRQDSREFADRESDRILDQLPEPEPKEDTDGDAHQG